MAITQQFPLSVDETAPQPGTNGFSDAALQSDRQRFLQLAAPLKKNLYNFIRKTMNNSPDAEDIHQETMLKAFRYFHSYRKDHNFRNWIFTIAHNLIRDYYRATPREILADDPDAAETIPFEHDVNTPLDAREIYRLAARMKPKKREIFFLYYYNDFPIEEIARITGASRYSIKFTLHQARGEIRKKMAAGK